MYKNTIGIILVLFLSCCVDDKYDLGKEVEIKVSFADDGLTLPTSNTQPIALDQIIELNEKGQLITDNFGDYLFYKAVDKMDNTVITIGQGSICNTVETLIDYHFKEDPNLKRTPVSDKYNTARLNFEISAWPNYAPDVMSESIRELDYIKTNLTISFMIYNSNVNEFASEISEIKYHVPSYYELADPSELTETHVRLNDRHEHLIHCKGVDFHAATAAGEKIGYDSSTGKITFIGKVGMTCTINTAHMTEYEALPDPIIQSRITVGTLGTNEVTGRFSKTESVDIDPIEFDDLPDFIKDKEVVIDLENPMVNLTIDNEVPIGAMVNASMHSIRDGKEVANLKIGDMYGSTPIYFAPSSRQTVTVSRQPIAEFPDTVSANVVIDNMMDILKVMPDRIEVEGFAHTDSTQTITMALNRDYIVRPSYELIARLIMGKNMQIVYTKEIDNMHNKLKNLTVTSMQINAEATNNIPLDLYAKAIATDKDGNVIDDIVLVQEEKIAANSKTNMSITLRGNADSFDRLERLTLKAYAKSSEKLQGLSLNVKQALQLQNARITVKSHNNENN